MLNRKGDIPVMILVILVLAITTLALFTFSSSNAKFNAQVSDTHEIREVLNREKESSFYVRDFLERAVILSYLDFAENARYIESPVVYTLDHPHFDNLNSDIDKNFVESVEKNFGIESDLNPSPMESFSNLQTSKDSWIFSSDENFVEFKFENFELEESELLAVKYSPGIFVRVFYSELGLETFNKISNVKKECRLLVEGFNTEIEESKKMEKLSMTENCFNQNLESFSTKISSFKVENDEFILVELESKKEFLTRDGFKKIKFDFVLE